MAQAGLVDVDALDPYAFFAVLGKRVIHPGGRADPAADVGHALARST